MSKMKFEMFLERESWNMNDVVTSPKYQICIYFLSNKPAMISWIMADVQKLINTGKIIMLEFVSTPH